ncbi:MAG: START-like domain-containing protein, partial [Bacteroidia bacterium]
FELKKQKGKLAPGEKRIFKTNVITHHVISEVPLDEMDKKGKPEPKGKFTLEYIIHTPVTLLYDFLTTPNGLAEWFADGVDMKHDIYTFDWDGQKQDAKIISAKIDNHIRLRWLDKPEGSYFEFRLNQDELTNEVSLNVTDFGEGDDDIATSRRLWDSQIQRLVKALGTY